MIDEQSALNASMDKSELGKTGVLKGRLGFEELRNAFREYFSRAPFEYQHPSNSFNGGDGWEYAVVKGSRLSSVHYELIQRGGEVYVELHVETHPRNVPNWQRLQCVLAENARYFMHYTYYSSNYWRTRTPLSTVEELECDLCRITNAVQKAFANDGQAAAVEVKNADAVQALPFQRDPKHVAHMLGEKGILKMPAVQRGKVWNASRIEALWDSILRGFSIGAFSVQRLDDRLDLLDGQQRSSAMALAYSDFPPSKGRELDSVLWLDINPRQSTVQNSQKHFMVYVTTASQPWGYASSSDETRNVLLSASERRVALKEIENWHDKKEKPYPGEFFPCKAEMPVPLNLLIKFAETDGEKTLSAFISWCNSRRARSDGFWWNWLDALVGDYDESTYMNSAWHDFFWHTRRDGGTDSEIPRSIQLQEFPVFFIDAGSVDENDVSLYFTRVGKGGVRPSDEEIAFSVLKSKLGVEFKNSIEGISERFGLAHPARVAHLAVRCFNSTEKSFFGASVLDAVLRMCKRGSDGGVCDDFRRFMHFVNDGEFVRLIEAVDQEVFGNGEMCLTQWHRNRFCSYHNGDVYLFLLVAKRFGLAKDASLPALSAIIFEKAMNPDRTIRYILNEGVREGIAHSMRETYRGVPRFGRITQPCELKAFEEVALKEDVSLSLLKDKARELHLSEQIASGYGNQKAYSMLLYACKQGYSFGSPSEHQFGYNPSLGIWAEDNCPWDYDHILPHSWIEKMPSGEGADTCNWLMNSIGNLAPLPFEINRSLSDDSRDADYPYCSQKEGQDEIKKVQEGFMIVGSRVAEMANFRSEETEARLTAIRAFCTATIVRYCQLYYKWYEGLKIDQLLSYPEPDKWATGPKSRYELLSEIARKWSPSKCVFNYYWHDNTERPIAGTDQQYEDWNIWDWVSISHVLNGIAIEVTVNRAFSECEFGVCKLASESAPNDRVRKLLGASIAGIPVCEKDDYWYAVKKMHPKDFMASFEELVNLEDECKSVALLNERFENP